MVDFRPDSHNTSSSSSRHPGDAVLVRLQSAFSERYHVERELGRGGMATVYLARDLRHERPVALKVLRPELATSLGAERFLHEIHTAAQLVHPHILAMYDSGEAGDLLYYIMPYVEGESLRDRLQREGRLAVHEAVRIARQVAEALAYAHARGIVHRDIKPENILLPSATHAVVADFGLARALFSAANRRLTATGLVVGSPLYMSPEQISGEHQIDGRADVYSLGCVLFEMVAGKPPFEGFTMQAVLGRHMTAPPPSLRRLHPEVPEQVEQAVTRALAKAPEERWRGVEEFRQALNMEGQESSRTLTESDSGIGSLLTGIRASASRYSWVLLLAIVIPLALLGAWVLVWPEFIPPRENAQLDPRRIAVLYFDDLSAEHDLGHLASGFTESLIHELSQVEVLDVISRNGVKPYKGNSVTLDSIARALRVGSVVEGSVRRSGDKVRITVQLIDAATGAHLQSQVLERPWGELFALEDDLVHEVAALLRTRLGEEIRLRGLRSGAQIVEAWNLVQQVGQLREAIKELRPFDAPTAAEAARSLAARADSLLMRAEALDPHWIEPIIERGWLALDQAKLPPVNRQRYGYWLDYGLKHAERAVALRPENARALELRGTLFLELAINSEQSAEANEFIRHAERDLRAAVVADPTLASAWKSLSSVLLFQANFAEAKLFAHRALEEDAYLTDANDIIHRLIFTSFELGHIQEASSWCARGAKEFPFDRRFIQCQLHLMAWGGAGEPDVERAWRLLRELGGPSREGSRPDESPSVGVYRRMMVAAVLARAGLADSARTIVRQVRADAERDPDRASQFALSAAHVELLLGDRDQALYWLRRYVEINPNERQYVARSSAFQPLRADPRFARLVAPN